MRLPLCVSLLQESEDERVISNDVHRTFTGHAFFSKADAAGQAAIFSVSKVKRIRRGSDPVLLVFLCAD